MTRKYQSVDVKRLWRYAGNCDRDGCENQARFMLRDLAGGRHMLCPGHKDAAVAALSVSR